MNYAYARVSSKDQKLDRQINDFIHYGIDPKNIYSDKESGKDFDRTNYQRLRKKLKKDDLLVIKSIDRLGRNYDMIIEEWSYLTKIIKCNIVVLDMNLLDTRTDKNNLIGKFVSDIVLQILSFVSENERNNIKQRQKEGIEAAKKKGIKFGRPKKIITPQINNIFIKYQKKECTLSEALKLTSLTKSTFYNYYNSYFNNQL